MRTDISWSLRLADQVVELLFDALCAKDQDWSDQIRLWVVLFYSSSRMRRFSSSTVWSRCVSS